MSEKQTPERLKIIAEEISDILFQREKLNYGEILFVLSWIRSVVDQNIMSEIVRVFLEGHDKPDYAT